MCVFDRYRRRKADEKAEKALAKVRALERARDVAGLAELLRDRRPENAIWAAAALGRIGGRDVVEALVAALDGPWVDGEIVASLGAIGDPIATDALVGLLRDSHLTEHAAAALARIGGRRVLDALTDAVTDPDFPGSRASLQDAVRALLPDLRRPSNPPPHLTRHAVAEVRRLAWAGDLDAATILLVQVRDGISSAEATAGASWGGASYARQTVDFALPEVARFELVAHHSVGPDALPITDDLDPLSSLDSSSPWLELLSQLEALLATLPEDLEQAAPSPPVDVQVDESIVEVMFRLLRCSDDDTAGLRRDTLIFLHRMNRLDSVEDLGTTLDDRSWWVRLAAVAALRKVADPEAMAVLRTRMDDENPEVRRAAVAVAVRKDGQVLRHAVRDPHGCG